MTAKSNLYHPIMSCKNVNKQVLVKELKIRANQISRISKTQTR